MTLDPLLDGTLRGSLALLFAWSASHKWRDLPRFAAVVREYEVLPVGLERPAALVLGAFEVVIAIALLVPAAHGSSSVAAAALLAIYTAGIILNLARGRRDLDCGCFGPAQRQPLSEWLVLRNVLLLLAALVVGLPAGARSLSALDAFAGIAGCTTLAMLWTSANQLVSQWPRMQAVRRSP
ncbi:MAG: MauE/DoxX family redox-associated membrane protein [Candidatus Binatia bacterium]|nr:MauE/DoxX family redox-associated membrane protein [Candidatus Binatia bacterium]